jgi:hypothetical protein
MYDARTKAKMWPTMDQRLLNCAYQLSLNDHLSPKVLANLAETAKMVPEDYDKPGYLAPLIEIFRENGHTECENCGTPHPDELTEDDLEETEKLLRSKGHLELCTCYFR